jgi:hypothetical protein
MLRVHHKGQRASMARYDANEITVDEARRLSAEFQTRWEAEIEALAE